MKPSRQLIGPGIVLLASALAATGFAAPAADTAADPALEARVQVVAADLRCLVCQNQSLADSHAPLAIDLKNQVREQLQAGHSPQQVVDYMTARYGDFVRYRPALKPTTVLLWAGPLLLVLAGVAGLWRAVARQQRAAGAEPALAPAEQDRADQLLGPNGR